MPDLDVLFFFLNQVSFARFELTRLKKIFFIPDHIKLVSENQSSTSMGALVHNPHTQAIQAIKKRAIHASSTLKDKDEHGY